MSQENVEIVRGRSDALNREGASRRLREPEAEADAALGRLVWTARVAS